MKIEKKEVKPVPPPAEFIVTLSEREATNIMAVIGAISGSFPEREDLDTLWYSLHYAGAVHANTMNPVVMCRKEKT